MKIKTWLIPTSALVLVGVLLSLLVRFSYQPLPEEELLQYTMNASQGLDFILERNDCTTFDDLTDKAELILFGRYTGECSFTDQAVYSKIQVEQVLKGQFDSETLTLIDEIYLYPPNNWYVNGNGRPPLKTNHELLLLLNPVEFSPYRTLPKEMENPYFPIFSSAFGCYDFSQEDQTELFDQETNYQIKDIMDADLVVTNQEDRDLYYRFKDEARKKYEGFLSR